MGGWPASVDLIGEPGPGRESLNAFSGMRLSRRSLTGWSAAPPTTADEECGSEKFVVATPPETSPVDFGAAVQNEARRRGMGRAKYVYLVMDGAIWLWDWAEDRFAQALKTLDFHHARDHLWAVANCLHGEDTPEAGAWVQPLLRSWRKDRENQVVRQWEELLENQSERTPEQQELIEREVKFFVKHRDHLHYQAMEKAGAPRGSGAVASLGKQLQQRLRGGGQIGGRPGFTRLLRVVVLVKNQDDHILWN